MKRMVLFLATNIAVLVVLSVIINIFGLDRWLTAEGINYTSLLVFSAVIGFGGAIISLLISKWMAKMSTGAKVIDGSEGTSEFWLVETVKKLAAKAEHRHARGGDLRGRAQRLRHRRVQELGAGRGLDRAPSVDEQGGS